MSYKTGNGNIQHDDDDLKDLITKSKNDSNISSGQLQVSRSFYRSCLSSIQYQVHGCCYFYPISCSIFMVCMVGAFLWLAIGYLLNPTQEYGVIRHDHSNIKSKLELISKDIDHWCLGGGDDSCTCDDPLIPLSRIEHKSWIVAHRANRRKLMNYNRTADVVFLGESIVEEMDGRWMGKSNRNWGMNMLEHQFNELFDKRYFGASVDGITLGIAGDTASNVLWRLMHGEMPDTFHPKVWWLFLGMDDLARTKCSEEVVVMGVLRIVEEIMEKRPKARIVINSLLPMAAFRGEDYPVISDMKDSFINAEQLRSDETQVNNGNRTLLSSPLKLHSRLLDEAKINGTSKQNPITRGADISPQKKPNANAEVAEPKVNKTPQRNPNVSTKVAQPKASKTPQQNPNASTEVTEPKKNKTPQRNPNSSTEVTEPKKNKGPKPKPILTQEEEQDEMIAEKEEVARDRKVKTDIFGRDRLPRIKLIDQARMKKFGAGRIRRKKVPLWTSIKAINKALGEFSLKHSPSVTFFDATSIFVTQLGPKRLELRRDLVSSRGMLTFNGYRKLEDAILKNLQPILDDLIFNDDYMHHDDTIENNSGDNSNDDNDLFSENSTEYQISDDFADPSIFNDLIDGDEDARDDLFFTDGSLFDEPEFGGTTIHSNIAFPTDDHY